MDKSILYTTGYEGEDIEHFLKKLLDNNIKMIIDVREFPISRKTGFSKTALKAFLNTCNIDYIHYKQLGSPKEIRKELHENKNYNVFFCKYKDYIENKETLLMELKDPIISETACLLCFEKDYNLCHRSILAKEIREKVFNKDLEVINI